MKKIIWTFLLLILTPTICEAKTKQELSEEIFNLPGMKASFEDSMASAYQSTALKGQVDEECFENKMLGEMEKYERGLLPYSYFLNYFVKTYERNFTNDELEEVLKFYKSTAGKKTILLAPQINVMVLDIITDYMEKYGEQVVQNLFIIMENNLKATNECQEFGNLLKQMSNSVQEENND